MPKIEDSEQYKACVGAQAKCDALIAESQAEEEPDRTKLPEFEEVMKEATKAVADMVDLRKGKGRPNPVEAQLGTTIETLQAELTKVQAAAKAAKDAARKALQAEATKAASTYLGDMDALKAAMAVAEDCGVPDKELNDPREKLTNMVTFHFELKEAAKALTKASSGRAATIATVKLENSLTECKEGAALELRKVELDLWLETLTKVSATQIATDALDEALVEAKAVGLDEKVLKARKKKCDEGKKAQNAKKIADRKAKKPPADPPPPPEAVEPDPTVGELKKALLDAMAEAEKKLLEAKGTIAMEAAAKPDLLKVEKLLDLGERPADEAHPVLKALSDCIKTAKEVQAEEDLINKAEAALKEATDARLAARRNLARTRLAEAGSAPPETCDVKLLTTAIEVAKAETVDTDIVTAADAKLTLSYKIQSENALEPLAQPQPLSHEGFQIIDPLKAAIDEAKKRGAEEDLQIKAQAKLEYWLEARTRRDKAKKEMDESLKPPPCSVVQEKVQECLIEATDAKVDPVLLAAAERKLEIARLAQQLYDKSEKMPGVIDIPVLEAELVDNGGEALQMEQQKLAECERECEELKTKIEAINETKASQKARDEQLKKQIKKQGNLKQKGDAATGEEMLPAWVRKDEMDVHEISHEVAEKVAEQQQKDMDALKGLLAEAEDRKKAQAAAVKEMSGTVLVPSDVVVFAQLKMKSSKCADLMQQLQKPDLLDLDCAALDEAIIKASYKFDDPLGDGKGALTVAGKGDMECNVPAAEINKAKVRLRDARKAQERQAKCRTQLQVRVNAPTGTATFDMLVKLVAEGKQCGVEEELILRAELKLKKMEELAASSLRAGPLAFLSFHCPCLRTCVSSYAISLVEKAEEKRKEDWEKAETAKKALLDEIGTWEPGLFDKSLIAKPETELINCLAKAVECGLPQDIINQARLKLAAIAKYKSDKAKGLIKDDEEEARKAAAVKASGGKAPKKKMKQYAFVKKQ